MMREHLYIILEISHGDSGSWRWRKERKDEKEIKVEKIARGGGESTYDIRRNIRIRADS